MRFFLQTHFRLSHGWQWVGCVLAAWYVWAVHPVLALDPHKLISQYTQAIFRKEQGLPANGILALAQTPDGYLWIGTFQGLARYDGLSFRIYKPETEPAFTNPAAWKLLVSQDGSLWVGTNGGGLLRYRNNQWTGFGQAQGLRSEVVTALFEDTRGRIWVGTRKGLNWFDPNLSQIRFQTIENSDHAVLDVRTIAQTKAGEIIISDHNRLFRVVEGPGAVTLTPWRSFEAQVSALYLDRSGRLWIGTRGGGVFVEKDGQVTSLTTAQGMPSDLIGAVVEDRDGNIWIGSAGAGLVRYSQETVAVFTKGDGLSGEDVATLFEDREGALWVGTYRDGLNQFQNGKFWTFTVKEGLPHNITWQVTEVAGGDIWVCTNKGLARLENGRVDPQSVIGTSDNVYTMIQDHTGLCWYGTQSGGVRRFDPHHPNAGANGFTVKEGLPSNQVRALCEDQAGRLWMGTPGGLCCWADNRLRTYTTEDGLPINVVLALKESSDGRLWIGTDGGGLVCMQSGRFTTYTVENGLPSNVIFSILEDREHSLWITTNAGIAVFRKGMITNLSRIAGMEAEPGGQLVEDNRGDFWFGSNRGMFQIPKKELLRAAEGSLVPVQTRLFTKADGLKNDEFTIPGIGLRSSDQRLWFATQQGVLMIQPRTLVANPISPTVVVEGVTAAGKWLPMQDDMTLGPTQNTFTVHCQVLSLCNPAANQIKYRIKELNSDWTVVTGKADLPFFNIKPGNYTFEAFGANNDGTWTPVATTFSFRVKAPLWRTPWVLAIGAVTGIGLLMLSVRFRTGYLVGQNETLQAKVVERTRRLAESSFRLGQQQRELQEQKEALEQANLKLQELDQIKAGFTAMLVHDLKSPLSVVKTAIELLKLDEAVAAGPTMPLIEASERSIDKVLNLVSEMLELSRGEAQTTKLACELVDTETFLRSCAEDQQLTAQSKGVALAIILEPGLPRINADRGKLERVFANLLSNSLKFTPKGGTITFEAVAVLGTGIDAGRLFVTVSVTDTGEGIPSEDLPYLFDPYRQASTGKKKLGVGLGLAIVKRIVAAHAGNVTVQSQPGVGSCFTVILPAAVEDPSTPPERSTPPGTALTQTGKVPAVRPTPTGGLPRLDRKRVLVVEDNAVNLRIISAQVKKLGYKVEVAENGLKAVEAHFAEPCDAILMDCYMPEQDGFEATIQIRAAEAKHKRTPIIALTSEITPETVEKCLSCGMDDFLGKPFSNEDLTHILNRWAPVRIPGIEKS
ncbi:MAG: response regulator [Blastocatellia bacterium]|nr:response regulator [Blastocatellia bacterium]